MDDSHSVIQAERDKKAQQVTLAGLWINLLLSIGKFVAGVLFHSQALIADGIHSASDLVTDVITLITYPLARKPEDRDHPYGHGRMESIASFGVAIILLGASIGLGYEAVQTILSGEVQQPTWPALVFAAIAVVVKEYLFQWTRHIARLTRSQVLMANAWHHRTDSYSSIAVLLGLLGGVVYPAFPYFDAIASLVVVIFILIAAFRILMDAMNDLADKAQDDSLIRAAVEKAYKVDGVHHIHRLRTRRYGPFLYMDLHMEVDPDITVKEGHEIAHQVKNRLMDEHDQIKDIMIHIEPYGSPHRHEELIEGIDPNSHEGE